ncbi:MAG: PucR family transcriptional regulator ligand-binding domain-containing protein [Bacillota bacterium]
MSQVGITVREAMQVGGLRKCRVVAGRQGLDRIITHVDVMEMPEVTDWLRPGVLLLTTFYAVRDSLGAQLRVLREFSEVGGAGLAVEPNLYLGGMPPDLIRLADQVRFPLIEVAPSVSWIDILTPILGTILNRQAHLLKSTEEVRQALTGVILEGKGLEAIVNTLSEWVGGDVGIRSYEPEQFIAKTGLTLSKDGCSHWPIVVGGESLGELLVAVPAHGLGEVENAAVNQGITVIALELMKRRAVHETEKRLKVDLLADFLCEEFMDTDAITMRARNYGWDFRHKKVVMVTDIDNFEEYCLANAGKGEAHVREVKARIYRVVCEILGAHSQGSIAEEISDSIIMLPDVPRLASASEVKATSRTTAERISAELKVALPSLTVSIGIGGVCEEFACLPRSYRQAREALALGRRVLGYGCITDHESLGAYRLLAMLKGSEEIRHFCEQVLYDLMRYDEANGTNLCGTLEAYMDAGENITAAAQGLYVHRSTLKYRLKRVQEVLREDPFCPENRFKFFLALKARRLLSSLSKMDQQAAVD